MKFILTDRPRYWWPVTVRVPDESNAGKIMTQTLKVLFEPKPREEAIAAQEAYSKLLTERERANHEKMQLLDIVKDWDDVIGADKSPVSFSAETFANALEQRWFRDGVYLAYTQSLNGEEAQAGN
ncbi:hypothetical protein [Brucella anthropi]|uniref:hypothetical protein n=1 Tax=Brucella anthropi TaxID=529 RepID=UPI00384D40C0